MSTAFHNRLLRVLVASAIVGGVGGWAFKRPMIAFACDSYGGCGDGSDNSPKALQKVAVAAAAGYTVLDVYRTLKKSGAQAPYTTDKVDIGSLWDLLQRQSQELGEVERLIRSVGTSELYDQDGPYTVFWPTDTALKSALSAERLAFLQSPAGQSEAKALLQKWTVKGRYRFSELRKQKFVRNLAGDVLSVTVDGDTVRIGGAELALSEYPATNGWMFTTTKLIAGN